MLKLVATIKKYLRISIAFICYHLGIVAICKRIFAGRGILILAYHRITNDTNDKLNLSISIADFETHIHYLTSYYQVISLKDAVQMLSNGQLPAKNMVVITFDDGYQDNYTNAFPILKKYAVPATIFLSTDPIQNGTRLWYDAIQETILGSSQKHIDLSAFGLGEFEIITAKQKDHAIHQITDHVKKFMNGCRKEEITEYLETRYSTNDDAGNSQWLMLNWDQIKEMARSGITFGAHTMTHPILTQISTEEAQREIQLSRKIIEENIGMKVDLFAYPNGNADDYNDKIIDLVKSEGFSAACTLIPGVNRRNNLYALYRLGIDNEFTGISNHFTKEIFASELAGIFDLLFFRFIRR